jgi:cell wall-associated NlpC family hydrolase
VTDTTGERAALAWRGGSPRLAIAAVLLAVALAGLGVALALRWGSHGSPAQGRVAPAAAPHPNPRATTPTHSTPTPSPAPGSASATVGGARRAVAEVRDPQEASSFPAPASARHQAATAPAKAGEAIVAAGAPSDAEVRAELAQMEAAERAARRTQQLRLSEVPGGHSIGGNGTIPIPANVPEVVQRVVAGGNAIANFPYVFGGGHGSFVDNAYDCSGSVSYALAAGGLLSAPLTSGELEKWGVAGAGRYITVLANAGHTYMYVNGVLFDTAGRSGVFASRWQLRSIDNSGYVARHWPGL